jgi:hypothetical protein
LRLLAGLTQPADGTITFGSRLVAKAGWALPPDPVILAWFSGLCAVAAYDGGREYRFPVKDA